MGYRRRKGAGSKFEKIMAAIFPNLMKNINHRYKKAQQTPSKRDITTPTNVIKLLKNNDRKKTLQAARKNMPYLI